MGNVNVQKAITAGVAGTFVMTLVMLVGPMMGMPKMDMGAMLGPMNPIVAMPYWMGWVMHFIIGVVLTLIYAAVFINKLPSSGWKRGAIWGLVPFFVNQIAVVPMMGGGFFTGGNMTMIVGSLVGHLLYGAVVGIVYGDG